MSVKQYSAYFLAILGIALIILSCGKDNTEPNPNPNPTTPTIDLTEERGKVAIQTANGLIIPAYQQLQTNANQLVATSTAFTESPDESTLTALQQALKTTWLTWQTTNMYMFGPGENIGLRKSLNTFPTDDTQIEANILKGEYILGSLDNQAAVGFPAIDYLINAQEKQAIIDQFLDEMNANRKRYLQDLVADIQSRVDKTLTGWQASGGNHVAVFTDADALGIDVGSSLSILVNSIDLHFQRFSRDGKVAIPAGIRSAGVPRPKTIEALYGGYSVELLVANLKAYERLFMGIGANDADHEGLYDYLIAIDAKDLGDDIKAQFQTTLQAAEALSDPLGEQIDVDLDKVTNVFLEMQKLVVFFKSDMASLMGISITNQDNDGD